MNKIRFVIFAVTLALIFTACGAVYEEEYDASDDITYDEIYGNAKEPVEEVYLARKELFLEDIDYLLYALENNFALFDVAYWAHGMDIRQSIDNIRADVFANPNMDVDGLFAAIHRETSTFGHIGHLRVVFPFVHLENYRNPNPGAAIFREENVLSFYEPRHPIGSVDSHMMADIMMGTGEVIFQNQLEQFALFGERELSEKIAYAKAAGDYDEAMALMVQAFDIIGDIPIVYTRIIEEGYIAYLTINSFGRALDTEEGREIIFSFYEEIEEFGHLIIDLRRNEGGRWDFFRENIIRPNITERISLYGFAFIQSGEYNEGHLEDFRRGRGIGFFGMAPDPLDQLWSVAEIIENYDLPDINMADMERMDYGRRLILALTPMRSGSEQPEPAFGGKIWLLTGPITASAGEIATRISMEAGFATHVGELSGGNYGGPRTFVVLPNTGIMIMFDSFYITDSTGRPFEAGTIPHHFNREGMDALETTLALIAEGEY
ncbi:MAG: S41 family peptidase [Defluviitaleaceae bacterium]|nr:S41 family peptidase [Defluviitaleaceae bacterium]